MLETLAIIATAALALAGGLGVVCLHRRFGSTWIAGLPDAIVASTGIWSGFVTAVVENIGFPDVLRGSLAGATTFALGMGLFVVVLRAGVGLGATFRRFFSGEADPARLFGGMITGGLAVLAWITGSAVFVSAGGLSST